MPTLKAGQRFDQYEILGFIANGGMGEVYHARHWMMGTDVALKLINGSLMTDPAMATRFVREVQSIVKLRHPHIVEVFNAGAFDGLYFMVMEYLSLGSLGHEIGALRERKQKMPIAKAINITRQIALALDHAHKLGFTHRDVKPANIMKRSEGHYVLTDFGLVLEEAASRLTHTGWGMGTPAYMPPEQWNGDAEPQSDIYALGIVLHEMLAGEAPFRATAPSALMIKHMTEPPPRLIGARPDAPPYLQNVLDIALAKKPGDRFATGAQFVNALDPETRLPTPDPPTAVLAASPPAIPPGGNVTSHSPAIGRPPTSISPSRRRILAIGGGVLGLGAVGLALGRLLNPPEIPAASATVQSAKPSTPPGPAATIRLTETKVSTLTPAATATATALPSAVRRVNANLAVITLSPGVEMEFVRVPAGEFLLGSDKGKDPAAAADELPQHTLTLPEYWMGKGPVQVTQFAAFVRTTGYKSHAEKEGKSYVYNGTTQVAVNGAGWSHPGGPTTNVDALQRHPVSHMSWDDSIAFASWAAKAAGVAIALASEAEWEKAARGTDGRLYPWGNDGPDATRLNFNLNVTGTTEVGQYGLRGASPYGCDDMAGNVWQWTRSLWGKEGSKPEFGYPYSNRQAEREDMSAERNVRRVLWRLVY
ncbi:MAG: bifunctional serine/threonine-protein kinase/formylglycine-generating enzyme family protein [Thermoflexales bacterium]